MSIDVGKKMKARTFNIKSPGELSKAGKLIEKIVAGHCSQKVRNNIIDSAYYIRDTVAEGAPKLVYREILMGIPLEKAENKNSGFDVTLNGRMNMNFVLKLSVNTFPKSIYLGYNPVIGLLVSNYGRGPIQTSEDNKMPIPVGSDESSIEYNHPKYGQGHRGRYSNNKVIFVTKQAGIVGTHWIEDGVNRASVKASNLVAGIGSYSRRRTKDKYWA